jgi:putative ABC transport system ATP-binding protein
MGGEENDENVELPLIYRGLTRKQREPLVLEALEAVNLLDRRKHFPSEPAPRHLEI